MTSLFPAAERTMMERHVRGAACHDARIRLIRAKVLPASQDRPRCARTGEAGSRASPQQRSGQQIFGCFRSWADSVAGGMSYLSVSSDYSTREAIISDWC